MKLMGEITIVQTNFDFNLNTKRDAGLLTYRDALQGPLDFASLLNRFTEALCCTDMAQ